MGREASRVVCPVGGTVRVIQHHTGLDKILLRHFAVRGQVRGGGGGRHNQPPHPLCVKTGKKAELIRRLVLSEKQRVRQHHTGLKKVLIHHFAVGGLVLGHPHPQAVKAG